MNRSEKIWLQATLPATAKIGEAIINLERVSIKIVLIVNETGVLQGTVSDGDIRRGLLKGLDLNSPLTRIIHRNALVVPPDMGRDLVMQLMVANKIQQIPVVDEQRHIVGLHLWDQINVTESRSNVMVIMAGGLGKRLLPHTENCPKPLLPVAGKPIIQHIIERAKLEGFHYFVISLNYLGHMIEDYFGSGEHLGVKISYVRETIPLGTAGALGLLTPRPVDPFVVTNGDVITDIRYGDLLDFHVRNTAKATMAVRVFEWQNPYGVVQTQGVKIVGFDEKPIIRSNINAGIYALDPDAISSLISNERCDMPSLFERLMFKNKKTLAYPMHEPWLDVGRPMDLHLANSQIDNKVSEHYQ